MINKVFVRYCGMRRDTASSVTAAVVALLLISASLFGCSSFLPENAVGASMSDAVSERILDAFGDSVTVALSDEYDVDPGEIAGGGYYIRISDGRAVIAAMDTDGADSAAAALLSRYKDADELSGAGRVSIISDVDDPLSVGSAVSSHMVLQRGKDIKISGTAAPGENVRAALRGDGEFSRAAAVAEDDGSFELRFPAMDADDDPKRLYISSDGGALWFDDILVGDVYMITGQSNSARELSYAMSYYGESDYPVDDGEPVRLYYQNPACRDMAAAGQIGTAGNGWEVVSAEGLSRFSAIGAYFAEEYLKNSGVPVGLIEAGANGATLSELTPADTAEKLGSAGTNVHAGAYYDLLISSFENTAMAGVIFYEGESEAGMEGYAVKYSGELCGLIGALRDRFGDPTLPVIEVQLTTHGPFGAQSWKWLQDIRQAQLDAASRMSGVYLVSTIDCGATQRDEEQAHPADKRPVGVRAARVALEYIAEEELSVESAAPYPIETELNGGRLTVRFANAGTGLALSSGTAAGGFSITYSDGSKGAATAVISSADTIEFEIPDGKRPISISYGDAVYKSQTTLNLTGGFGTPAAAFVFPVK